MFTGLAHTAVCVGDIDQATKWYSETLGLRILSPPYEMAGEAIERDMGELVPSPVVVRAAIVGLHTDDHVLELIEYPQVPNPTDGQARPDICRPGITHVGLVCENIEDVTFLTSGIADVAGLKTTWFSDPWGTVFILLEKTIGDQPYWRQYET
jgi:catechol 2,3-dioxygenase-like lactoylglutathione lyase family enzyme